MTSLHLFSPSGVVSQPGQIRLASQRLQALGFEVTIDESALKRHQRFAGDDEVRLEAIHRVAKRQPAVAMATRGGYGLSRLLDRMNWKALGRSVSNGTRWVGYSDFTALHLGLLAHTQAISWAGPTAMEDFGRPDEKGGVDDVTAACSTEAMSGELEAVGFRTDVGFDGLGVRGTLWGGNLTMVNALLGTPHFPDIRQGILFLEDVNEHPYRVERALIQLMQAGVLQRQRAIVLGQFSDWRPSPLDRGYNMNSVWRFIRSQLKVPVLTGLPFGHVPTRVSLPVGARVTLFVEGREAFLQW